MSTSKDYKSNEAVDMEGKSEARGKWVKEENVLLASIIATQSLGNVWVLPYYCYIYGGGKIFLIYTHMSISLFFSGSFLLAYLIGMGIFGLPCVYQELVAGQYFSTGGMTLLARFSPLLKGFIFFLFATQYLIIFIQVLEYQAWCMYSS